MKNNLPKLNWDTLKLLPILIFIGIMPLTVRLKMVYLPDLIEDWLQTPYICSDIFNYYKSKLILLSALIALVFLCIGWILGKIQFNLTRVDMCALGFFFVVLISTLMSSKSEVVWFGYPERWHGFWTWTSYIIMYFYIKLNILSKKDLTNSLYILLGSGLIMTFIGLLQILSMDPLRLDIMKKLITPSKYLEQGSIDSFKFTFELNRVYLTLYNPNNVGLYAAAMLPMAFWGFAHSKSKIIKALWITFGILSVIALVGSYSRTGIIVLLTATAIYSLANLKVIRNHKKVIILAILAVFLSTAIGNSLSGHILTRRLFQMFDSRDLYTKLETVDINEKNLTLEYNNKLVVFDYEDRTSKCTIYEKDGTTLSTTQNEDGYFSFENAELAGLNFGYLPAGDKGYALELRSNKLSWRFYMDDTGFKYINSFGKPVDIQTAPSLLFDGKERLGSNRGYIWSRSLPLIMDKPIIGSGPDSYALRFPQKDYIMLGNVMGNPATIVDKPHSQYVGIAVELGLLGLLLFLVWSVLTLIHSRSSLLSISLLTILLAFAFYDISTCTGWTFFFTMGVLNSQACEAQTT